MPWSQDNLYHYLGDYAAILHKIQATDGSGKELTLPEGIARAISAIAKLKEEGRVLRFIGNGGSAGLAMHQCTDFFRTANIGTDSLFDPTLITCMGNDVGFENIFAEPLRIVAKKGDILVAISSSGGSKPPSSQNILRAVNVAMERENFVVTLSGFDPDNPLRKMGNINFYAPSFSYRFVENAHLFVCNWILDFLIESNG